MLNRYKVITILGNNIAEGLDTNAAPGWGQHTALLMYRNNIRLLSLLTLCFTMWAPLVL